MMARAMLFSSDERSLEKGIQMDSVPLLVFVLFIVPTIGMGLALLVAVLHRAARPVACGGEPTGRRQQRGK